MSASYCLTRRFFYDIVDGRMEELRSFFYAQNQGRNLDKCSKIKAVTNNNLSGGGSRAHKNYTGMYRMQTTQLQHD